MKATKQLFIRNTVPNPVRAGLSVGIGAIQFPPIIKARTFLCSGLFFAQDKDFPSARPTPGPLALGRRFL
jgi:hypothetical protein